MSKSRRRPGSKDPAALRKQAEEMLARPEDEIIELPPHEAARLLHELRVHQIELEMQNEELRRTQLDLQDARDRYADLYDFAPVGYFSLDGKGRIISANYATANMIGMARRILLGKDFIRFVAPDSRVAADSFFGKVLQTGTKQSCEVRVLTSGGAAKEVLMEGIVSESHPRGDPQCHVAIMDISDRKRAEEELQRAKEELEMKVEERTRVLDQRMREINCLYLIANVLTQHDLPLQNVLQRAVELIPTGFRYREHVCARLRLKDLIFSTGGFEGKAPTLSLPVRSGDETEGVLEVVYAHDPFPNKTEPFSKDESLLLSAISDLLGESIARSRSRTNLKESETRFKRLFEEFDTLLNAIPDTIVLLSRDLKILWANRAAAEAGIRPDDFGQRPCFSRWYDDKADCNKCPVRECFDSGRSESGQFYTPHGAVWDVKAFPIAGDDGRPRNVIAVARDITDKLKLEQETIRSAKLATLGELSASIAHEINNPVNSIVNYAQILADKGDKQRTEHALTGEIIQEGMRIAAIVRSLLSFARDTKERKVPVAVGELISSSLALTNTLLQKEGIRVAVTVPDDVPPVMGNAQQLQQVFLNIINNARYALKMKYPGSHKEKALDVSAEKMAAESGDGDIVRISFRDNGAGIPASIIGKVKEPFFTTKSGSLGTGLGLSISNTIVTDHKGSLAIDSVEGEYTSVTVELPAHAGHGAAVP